MPGEKAPVPTRAEMAASLRVFPLLANLPAAAVERLAAGARFHRLAAGAPVFRQGEPARGFFAIVTGGVRVFRRMPDGRERVLHRLRTGQTFAEAAVLSMPAYPAAAVATATPTELIEVSGRDLTTLVEGDPAAAKSMIASLASWLIHLVGRVEELTVLSADARLARYLLDLPSRQADDGFEMTLPLAKKDLAAHLGITPETLSRVLRRWTDEGLLRSKGGTVTVLSIDGLVALAGDAGAA